MSAQRTTTQEVTMAHKITTSFVAEGERTVKVDGEYAGTIARFPREGWKYMGRPKAFRTFTEAEQFTAKRYLARKEAGRVSLVRSEEHTTELQSLMRISYAVFFLK